MKSEFWGREEFAKLGHFWTIDGKGLKKIWTFKNTSIEVRVLFIDILLLVF